MGRRFAVVLLLGLLCGCAGKDGAKYTVLFPPGSAELDQQATATVQAAAAFARANPVMPITIQGYQTRPDPTVHDTLRELRTAAVKTALLHAGVADLRIEVLGTGLVYAKGVQMPTLPPGQVDINIGL